MLKNWTNKIWQYIEQLFESFKFKEDDLWYHKFLKILLRVVSILVLLALSPLILATILLIVFLAS